MTRPSSSSGWRTYTLTRSPETRITAASLRPESSRLEITPSDLAPMSTRTSSGSTRTTTPSTMSP